MTQPGKYAAAMSSMREQVRWRSRTFSSVSWKAFRRVYSWSSIQLAEEKAKIYRYLGLYNNIISTALEIYLKNTLFFSFSLKNRFEKQTFCMCALTQVCRYVYVAVYGDMYVVLSPLYSRGDQRSTLGVFHNCCLSYFLSQGLFEPTDHHFSQTCLPGSCGDPPCPCHHPCAGIAGTHHDALISHGCQGFKPGSPHLHRSSFSTGHPPTLKS